MRMEHYTKHKGCLAVHGSEQTFNCTMYSLPGVKIAHPGCFVFLFVCFLSF